METDRGTQAPLLAHIDSHSPKAVRAALRPPLRRQFLWVGKRTPDFAAPSSHTSCMPRSCGLAGVPWVLMACGYCAHIQRINFSFATWHKFSDTLLTSSVRGQFNSPRPPPLPAFQKMDPPTSPHPAHTYELHATFVRPCRGPWGCDGLWLLCPHPAHKFQLCDLASM